MKSHPKTFLFLILATVFSLNLIPANSEAQGFSLKNPLGFLGIGKSQKSDELSKNVYLIDQVAEQMAWRYGWEIRYKGDSANSAKLLEHMKQHTGLTNDLVKAYKGDSAKDFVQAASNVRANLIRIQDLRKQAKVSDSVRDLITKSSAPTSYVHRNSHLFSPGSAAASSTGNNNDPKPAPADR